MRNVVTPAAIKLKSWVMKLGFRVEDLSQEVIEVFMKVLNRSKIVKKNVRKKRQRD